jgi:hypothetical protein
MAWPSPSPVMPQASAASACSRGDATDDGEKGVVGLLLALFWFVGVTFDRGVGRGDAANEGDTTGDADGGFPVGVKRDLPNGCHLSIWPGSSSSWSVLLL